jgi:hypothetical protein
MPYMQRITWSGVAMDLGVVPDGGAGSSPAFPLLFIVVHRVTNWRQRTSELPDRASKSVDRTESGDHCASQPRSRSMADLWGNTVHHQPELETHENNKDH